MLGEHVTRGPEKLGRPNFCRFRPVLLDRLAEQSQPIARRPTMFQPRELALDGFQRRAFGEFRRRLGSKACRLQEFRGLRQGSNLLFVSFIFWFRLNTASIF